MHLALVIDPQRLVTDVALLQRLAVALTSEGIRVLRIMPPSADEPALARLIPALSFDFESSFLFRRSRLGALSSALERDRPDVFISFGPRAFEAAAALADDLDAGLVAVVSTQDELDATPIKRALARIDTICAATAPIAARAAVIAGELAVQVLPLGVPIPTAADRTAASPQSLAIAGSGRDHGAYRAVFAAIADVMPALPDLQVAIELPSGHDVNLWRLAREMGIQQVLNGVSQLESIRPLTLACGVMAVPEAIHGTRPILLEAMSLGRTIVAMDDPFADYQMSGVTVLQVRERSRREWTEHLTRALLQPDSCTQLGQECIAMVGARFASARCAELLGAACESIVRGPSIPFAIQ